MIQYFPNLNYLDILFKILIPSPTPDLLNQNFKGQIEKSVFSNNFYGQNFEKHSAT